MLHKKSNFNDQEKFSSIWKAIKSDQYMLQVLFLGKADMKWKVEEICLK